MEMKRNWLRRILSAALIMAIVLSNVPFGAFAQEMQDECQYNEVPVSECGCTATEENLWVGKSAVFVGDSITAGSGTNKTYYKFLKESLELGSVTAMGVPGSCFSAASDYGQSNQPLINRYQNIPSADLILVFMGTNDYGHETPIGSPEDTRDGTFYGALNTIVPALAAKHTSSRIVFVTPMHRYGFGTSKILGTQFTYDNIPNGAGATLGDYVNALKAVCARNGVTVIDLYTECTLDPSDAAVREEYIPDGLHPNAAGHGVIAGIMEKHIRGIAPPEKTPEPETELVYGNKFAAGYTQHNRASSRINLYLKAGTVVTFKNIDTFQWTCARTDGETSSNNLGYFPDSVWTDKETAVVEEDGWVGFAFKYRDESKSFDLTKPLSDYISIEEIHTHSYENGICIYCGAEQSGPIVIVRQPVPDDAVPGEKATITVEAKGDGLKYAWYFKDAGKTGFTKSTIATATYTLTVKESNANRVLYCVITDAHGNQVTTDTVNLIQVEELAITRQPEDASAVLNEKVTVKVEAAGYPLTYSWYFRDAGAKAFQKSSITGAAYTLTMTEARANREVYCVVTDAHGNKVTSDTVKLGLAVKEELEIITQPVPDDAVPGEKATITVEAKGDALKYTWYFKDAGKTGFTKSTIATATYTLTVKESNANRVLYCVITDAHGNQVTTDTVNLIQVEELAITRQPEDASAVMNEKVTVKVEAAGYPLTYSWYFRDAGAKAFQKSSITGAAYTLTMTEARANREVYCVVTDAHGNKVTSDTVKLGLAVKEELEIITQPVPDDAVVGEKATITVEAKGDALKYTWYFKDAGKTGFTKSTIATATYTLTVKESNANRVLYCVITDAHGNQVTTNTVNLIRTGEVEEDNATYYASLGDALSGVSGSHNKDNAVAKAVETADGVIIVLLQDIAQEETLTITDVMTLDLNGHTISSTASTAICVKAEQAVIRGGKVHLTAHGAGTSSAPAAAIRAESGVALEIYDAEVTAVDDANGTVVGVLGEKNSDLKIVGTNVLVSAEESMMNAGVRANGTAALQNCTVIAEADYTANAAHTDYASNSYGISAEKELRLENCYVWGAHSGVRALGAVYVDGGTYEGYGHGSFYFAGASTTSYIYNASLNWAKMREGTYADSFAGTNGAGMYVGLASNITIYMDNCDVYGTLYGVVLRNSGGEKKNHLYVSGSRFTGCSTCAYRNGQKPANTTLIVYSGAGNDYSAVEGTVALYTSRLNETGESYARMPMPKAQP